MVDEPDAKVDYLRAYLERYPYTTESGRPKFFGERWRPDDEEIERHLAVFNTLAPEIPVVMVTAHGDAQMAVRAMKAARLALGSYRGARGRDLAAPRRRRSAPAGC